VSGTEQTQTVRAAAHVPSPPSEAGSWLLAGLIGIVGLGVLLAVLSGALPFRGQRTQPPPVIVIAPTPHSSAGAAAGALEALRRPSALERRTTGAAIRASGAARGSPAGPVQPVRVSGAWLEGFYPIYETAQRTFGVNWLLLASIHMQETAFSSAAGTYHGLNVLHCCGGPMQFNVTNGPVSTWDLVANSYVYARRPARYDHRTAAHPSIYDDFDAIMAAAHLLAADGAGYRLDGSAWVAAYDYYGHGREGVSYADEVIARAIGWSQHGFCPGCAVSGSLLRAVYAAWGAPVLASIEAEELARARARALRRRRPAPAAPRPRGR
jgi:hypothetical protein